MIAKTKLSISFNLCRRSSILRSLRSFLASSISERRITTILEDYFVFQERLRKKIILKETMIARITTTIIALCSTAYTYTFALYVKFVIMTHSHVQKNDNDSLIYFFALLYSLFSFLFLTTSLCHRRYFEYSKIFYTSCASSTNQIWTFQNYWWSSNESRIWLDIQIVISWLLSQKSFVKTLKLNISIRLVFCYQKITFSSARHLIFSQQTLINN